MLSYPSARKNPDPPFGVLSRTGLGVSRNSSSAILVLIGKQSVIECNYVLAVRTYIGLVVCNVGLVIHTFAPLGIVLVSKFRALAA